jgi:hypothetical protein
MNQHLAHDSHAALVSCPVNAMCLAPDGDQQRLVCVAEETPIAFRYDSFSHAVMMATPADLEDFAMGFSHSEGIIEASADLQKVSICREDEGVVIDISLSGTSLHRYLANRRVRQLNGRTSCGLCGVEDLKDVRRPAPRVRAAKLPTPQSVQTALNELRGWQPLSRHIDVPPEQRDVVQLITLRSNGQFNTTVYNYDDRLRGIYGSRHVVLMHRNDIDRLGLKEGEMVALTTAVDDGIERRVEGLRVVAYDIPEGCIASYYPECNPLLPLWHHAEKSKVPAAKSIPVRVHASTSS